MNKKNFFKKTCVVASAITLSLCSVAVNAQTSTPDAQTIKKAQDWVTSLNLNDAAKETRVENVIATHLTAVRDWNNSHPYTQTPAGINPETGNKLSEVDRQIIACSTIPASVHENLMTGLRKDLNAEQVDAILDKYTVGKVAFTMKGYEAIVPDLTDTERNVIMTNIEQAREQAVDYKNMKEISRIFEIYKNKNELYLNTHGRNWHQLFKDYVNKVKAEKAAKAKEAKASK